MAKEEICHAGKVTAVGPGTVRVEITSVSACASCHAAGLCPASEAVRKAVEVRIDEPYTPGEAVEVVLEKALGLRAAVLCYAVPLFILLILTVSLSFAGLGEVLSALIGVAGMALWYLLLYLRRDSLSGEYVFRIRRPAGTDG